MPQLKDLIAPQEPILVEVEGVGELEFPAGTDQSVIDRAVQQEVLRGQGKIPVTDDMRGSEVADALMQGDAPGARMLRSARDGGFTSIGGPAIDGTRKVITGIARRLYQRALKPTDAVVKETRGGGAEALAEAGLREGITVSKGGLAKTGRILEGIEDQVEGAIKGSNATISRTNVMRRLADPVKEFSEQVDPMGDLRQIADKGRAFMRRPAQIPVEKAQAMKRGTYRAQAKKYGQQAGAEVEAEKALARGLKEEIATAVPSVTPLNARSSSLIPLEKALFDAVRRTGNRDPLGLGDVIAAGTQPGLLAATLAMKAAPMSMGARVINRVGQAGPTPEALQAAVRALMLSQ